ncbi:hypothetical protein C2W62_43430 [Candidatus Entotheonella serta]|nr:hypothetical protein C2W62_43430 [Candidatus Entotheonella serta]
MYTKTQRSIHLVSLPRPIKSPQPRITTVETTMRAREANILQRQQTIGNRATRNTLRVGSDNPQVPTTQTAPTRPARSRTQLNWPTLVEQAKTAAANDDYATATPLYQEAIVRAARNATFPQGVQQTIPSMRDIQIVFDDLA